MTQTSLDTLGIEIEKKASEMKTLRLLILLLSLVIIGFSSMCLFGHVSTQTNKSKSVAGIIVVLVFSVLICAYAYKSATGLDNLIDYLN